METNNYVVRSNEPTVDFLSAIRQLLLTLRIHTPNDLPSGKARAAHGSLEAVMKELGSVLAEDFRTNRDDAAATYRFEFVVVREGFGESSLAVLTRLYSDNKPGSVLYGSVLVREGTDEFSLWIDLE